MAAAATTTTKATNKQIKAAQVDSDWTSVDHMPSLGSFLSKEVKCSDWAELEAICLQDRKGRKQVAGRRGLFHAGQLDYYADFFSLTETGKEA